MRWATARCRSSSCTGTSARSRDRGLVADLHDGIESTLTMLARRLKKGDVRVVREFDRSLPPIDPVGGDGTGLGLDIVRRIVENHRGQVRLVSSPGDTRFEVRLPIG